MLEFPPDTEDPAYRAIFKTPTLHADKVRYDTQSLLNKIVLELLDPTSSQFLDKASANGFIVSRVAELDVQTRAELEGVAKLIFEKALDHGDRDGTGSKMAAFCVDVLHALYQRFESEWWDRWNAEAGAEVGKTQVLATAFLIVTTGG